MFLVDADELGSLGELVRTWTSSHGDDAQRILDKDASEDSGGDSEECNMDRAASVTTEEITNVQI